MKDKKVKYVSIKEKLAMQGGYCLQTVLLNLYGKFVAKEALEKIKFSVDLELLSKYTL